MKTYSTRNGLNAQLNLAIKKDTLDKFHELCQGDSKSVIFSQWVREKYALHLATAQAQPVAPTKYGILGSNQ